MTINIEQGEYTRSRYRSGRYKRRNLRNAWKKIKSLHDRVIYRLEACNPYCTANAGRLALWNFYNTTAPTSSVYPMHIYNLSIIGNTSSTYQDMAWAPVQTSTVPETVGLVPLSNSAYTVNTWTDPDGGGTSQPKWWIEKAPGPGGTAVTNPFVTHTTHKWIDIKLLLYGTKNLPTMYDVMLCYVPDKLYNFQFHVEYTSSSNSEWINFMQDATEKFAFNPIHTADPTMTAKIKPVWHRQFIIQTPVTNEGDAAVPHFREVRIFKKLDKICAYTWKDQNFTPQVSYPDGAGNATRTNASYNEQQGTNYIKNTPDYSKNLFLVIRAISGRKFGTVPPSTVDTLLTPTYDIIIRSCHEYPARGYAID